MEEKGTNGGVLAALSDGMADAVEKAGRSVVKVNARRRWPASGVIYAEDLVLTASHAVERDEDFSVETDDSRVLGAELVGRDPASDLALLRVEDLGATATPPKGGSARVGQLVLAVGRPGGEGPRASFGIVSALGSAKCGEWERRRSRAPERYVQADTAPYPGLGGGSLVDIAGNMLGVVTAGLGRGTTLAVPAEDAWRVAERLARRGSSKRGYLGVYSQPVRLPHGRGLVLTQEGGLLIAGVGDDTPASRGGLMIGDVLVTIDGQPVEDTDDLLVVLDGDRAGESVPVQVVRGGELISVEVTVGERD